MKLRQIIGLLIAFAGVTVACLYSDIQGLIAVLMVSIAAPLYFID